MRNSSCVPSDVTGWTQHRVSFHHEADKNQHTGGMSVFPNWTAWTQSKMYTNALRGTVAHTHLCLNAVWGSGIWQTAPWTKTSMSHCQEHKWLVKHTVNSFCHSPECKYKCHHDSSTCPLILCFTHLIHVFSNTTDRPCLTIPKR